MHEEGSEKRPADADGDNRSEGFSGSAHPLAVAHLIGEVLDLIQHFVHVRHDVLAIHVDHLVLGRARRDVQHRAVLGGVDVLAAEHGVDLPFQIGGVGESVKLLHRLGRHALARVVAVHAVVLHRQRLAPLGVGDQVAKVRLVDLLLVLHEIRPLGGGADQRRVAAVHGGDAARHGRHPAARRGFAATVRGELCVDET